MPLALPTLLLILMLGDGSERTRSQPEMRPAFSPSPVSLRNPAEPPQAEVCVGDPAPNFSYQGFDGRWMRLHHLVDQGAVLLVFGAKDAQLEQLQRERDALLALGVLPVAVVDRRPGVARSLVSRLGLTYTLLSDGRGVIASQFNVIENGRVTPGWFVLDRRGRVRGLLRGGLPEQDYVRLCARALALPMPGTLYPTSR